MDKSRQQFEGWFSVNQNNHLDQLKRDQRGNYFYIVTRTAWEAWQASRESLEVELPEFRSRGSDMYYDGFYSCLDAIREELISNGVKIKNE